jgi:hypothetical protein
MLTSCQQERSSGQQAREPEERIVIESGGGMFTRQFKLEASSVGHGTVEWIELGEQEPRPMKRAIAYTPEAFARFRAALAPYKPTSDISIGQGDASGACEMWAMEMGGVGITWFSPGSKVLLGYEDGCKGPKVDPIKRAVAQAPKLVLPPDLAQKSELVDVHPTNH